MAFSQEYLDQLAGRGRVSGNYNIGISGPVAGAAKPITPNKEVMKPSQPNFAAQVAKQTFNAGSSLAKSIGTFAVNTPRYVFEDLKPLGQGLARLLPGGQNDIKAQQQYQAVLDNALRQTNKAYKSGQMSKENYQKRLKDIGDSYDDLSKEWKKTAKEADRGNIVESAAMAAADILTGGGGSLVKAVGKKPALKLADDAVKRIEDYITKVPAGRELLERNARKAVLHDGSYKLAGESTEAWIAREGRNVAVGLLIKRPIFYQTNIGLAEDSYNHVIDGDYGEGAKSAAWIGAQMIGGGPIGWFYNKGKQGFSHLGSLARGKGSFIDELSARIGDGNRGQIIKYLNNLHKGGFSEKDEAMKTFKILQATNLKSADGNVNTAVDNVLDHYIQHGIDPKTLTPSQLYKDMNAWAKADELAQKTIKEGVIKDVGPEDVGKYAVVRWDSSTKEGLANAIRRGGDSPQEILNTVNGFAEKSGVGWTNNEILMNKIYSIVGRGLSKEETALEIYKISTASTLLAGVPKTVAKQLSDLGYTIAAPFGGNKIARIDYDNLDSLPKLVTAAVKGDTTVFDAARSPEPVLSSISGLLTKAGVSPEAANTVAHQKLSESLIGNLGALNISRNVGLQGEGDMVTGGRAILSELQRYIENKKGAFLLNKISNGRSAVVDVRQLTNDEIATALKITKSEAKDVGKAIRQAYLQVPLEFRGLGDKVVDWAIAAPFSPMRYYLRTQSALRYTYNPFFRFQEQVETQALASMNADKFIWATKNLDNTVDELQKGGMFNGNIFGSGADDNVIGRISANLTHFQKRNLAGLAEHVAKAQGKTVTDLMRDNPEQLDDALRIIVQYGRTGALSSPLARTLNIAFFPMRYNLKVSMLVAEKLVKQPPSIQFAMLQGFLKAREWLKSDEGIQWQADHAEAIQVFKWATPVGNIATVGKMLGGNVDSWGDMGLIGGLPFGVISQILDAEGIINLNKPYVNPSTGDVYPDYIPETTKAQAAVALEAFIGTLFSFPGRTLGLPGKQAAIRDAVGSFVDTEGEDFTKQINTDQLTPLQKQMVKVLQGDTSEETINSLYYSPAPGQFDYYTLPSFPIVKGINEPQPVVAKRTGLPSNKKATKGPKVKPRPQPIPVR